MPCSLGPAAWLWPSWRVSRKWAAMTWQGRKNTLMAHGWRKTGGGGLLSEGLDSLSHAAAGAGCLGLAMPLCHAIVLQIGQ